MKSRRDFFKVLAGVLVAAPAVESSILSAAVDIPTSCRSILEPWIFWTQRQKDSFRMPQEYLIQKVGIYLHPSLSLERSREILECGSCQLRINEQVLWESPLFSMAMFGAPLPAALLASKGTVISWECSEPKDVLFCLDGLIRYPLNQSPSTK